MFVSIERKAAALLAAGLSVSEAAGRLGVAANTVAYHRDKPPKRVTPPADHRHTVGAVSTRGAVRDLLAEGLTGAEIARELGVTKSTVSYHMSRLGEPRDDRCARRYDWAAVQDLYDAGRTKKECEAAFGFASQSWHDAVKRGDIVPRPRALTDEQLFVNGTRRSRFHLKQRIAERDLKAMVCAACGIAEWRGAPLSLALHHVNGERHDNRLENLELLCPNCHSQTGSFAGRRRPARAEGETAQRSAEGHGAASG